MRRLVFACALALAATPALSQIAPGKEPGLPPSPKTCDDPPTAVRDIRTDRVYRDPRNSVVDAVVVDRNTRALAGIDRPMRTIVGWSSLWLAKKDAAAATCALAWMTALAKGGAMLGVMSSQQAEGDRKWRTAGVAMAYLKLKERATPEQVAAIDPWLNALADKVTAGEKLNKTINNRRYWAGFAAAAVGFATGNETHKTYARAAFDQGLADVAPDGALPAEMGRGQLAAHLHNYALAPLILTAEVAARHGQNWYGEPAGPLHRLVAFVAALNADPSVIAKAANAHQKQPSSGILGWQAFYAKRFPGKLKPVKGAAGPWEYSWLGGDLTGLAAAWVK